MQEDLSGRFYIGVVDRGGEGFGIWFPDLPGCTSGGASLQDLFAMGIEALALWAGATRAAGRPVPPPRDLDTLRADPQVRAAIATDADVTFLAVPLLLEAQRPVKANISLDAGLLETIDAAATRLGLTRSGFFVSAAREKIGRG